MIRGVIRKHGILIKVVGRKHIMAQNRCSRFISLSLPTYLSSICLAGKHNRHKVDTLEIYSYIFLEHIYIHICDTM